MTVWVAGDTHGDAEDFRNIISQIENPKPEDYIIIAGDAGLEYGNFIMGSCKKVMKKFPGKWIIMRGNHDTRYWREYPDWPITKDGQFKYQEKYPNILYVRDGGQLSRVDGYDILFIPGAYSIDKEYRLSKGWPYEPEEQLTQTELINLALLAENFHIDFIIGHTYPFSIEKYLQYLFINGIKQSEVDKTMEHAIDNILSKNNTWKHYFFGHMHDDKSDIKGKYTLLYNTIINLDDYKD